MAPNFQPPPAAVSSLGDVRESNPLQGDGLGYDAGAQVWRNVPQLGFFPPGAANGGIPYLSTADSADLALSGVATANFFGNSGRRPGLANDGDGSTAWNSYQNGLAAEAAAAWWQVDFGAPVTANKLTLIQTQDIFANSGIASFKLQGTNDGVTFTDIKTWDGLAAISTLTDLFPQATFRSWRIQCLRVAVVAGVAMVCARFATVSLFASGPHVVMVPIGAEGQKLTVVGGIPAWV